MVALFRNYSHLRVGQAAERRKMTSARAKEIVVALLLLLLLYGVARFAFFNAGSATLVGIVPELAVALSIGLLLFMVGYWPVVPIALLALYGFICVYRQMPSSAARVALLSVFVLLLSVLGFQVLLSG
jgi:uncharacterized BrkB/YihY/UPF0761 family membrane protein